LHLCSLVMQSSFAKTSYLKSRSTSNPCRYSFTWLGGVALPQHRCYFCNKLVSGRAYTFFTISIQCNFPFSRGADIWWVVCVDLVVVIFARISLLLWASSRGFIAYRWQGKSCQTSSKIRKGTFRRLTLILAPFIFKVVIWQVKLIAPCSHYATFCRGR